MKRGLATLGARWTVVLVVLLFAGCVSSYHQRYVQPEKMAGKGRNVAVLPLVNLTSHPQAGRIVGDVLSTELYAVSGFHLMERTEMQERINASDDDVEAVMDKAVAQKLGKELGADLVVYGSVSEFRYKRGIDQSPAVGINLRMLDVNTGEVLWAASMSKTGGCFITCDDSLNRLAQVVCRDMVQAMLGAAQR